MTQILNTSIAASWLVLAVIAARLLLPKAPKAFHCALWALVAIRLLCPFSLESPLSLVPSREVIPEHYLTEEPPFQQEPVLLEPVTNPLYSPTVTQGTVIPIDTTVEELQLQDVYATLAWWTGMGFLCIYAIYSYLTLRIRTRFGAWVAGRVWECDEVDSPFILGILRPRIYLPSHLDSQTRTHVLAHEYAHLNRGDQFWKPLGYVLLTIHWFNPIMWLAYWLLCRDIELACDEKVIQKLDRSDICRYSESLIQCSIRRNHILACPLAFGEVGVKGRVKTMLNYKKPTFWVILVAIVAAIALAVCFMTDPVVPEETTPAEPLPPVAQETYLYPQVDNYGSCARITLKPDGTAWFVNGYGGGECTYSRTETTLTLSDTDDDRVWTFAKGEDGLYAFDAERSSPARYYEKNGKGGVTLESGTKYSIINPRRSDYQQNTTMLLNSTQDTTTYTVSKAKLEDVILDLWLGDGYGQISHGTGSVIISQIWDGNKVTCYTYSMYQEYEEVRGGLLEAYTVSGPVAVTFAFVDGDSQPRSNWPVTNPDLMPEDVISEIHEREEELKEICRKQCLENATEFSKDGGWLEISLEYLLDEICGPDYSTLYQTSQGLNLLRHNDYYRWIMRDGKYGLRYMLYRFAEGGQEGNRGQLMAFACQDTIDQIGGCCHIEVQESGQEWFDRFAEHAKQTLAEVGEDALWENHLGCALALEALEIIKPRVIYNHPYNYNDWHNSPEGQRVLYGIVTTEP